MGEINSFSDQKFWQLIADDLQKRSGLGLPSTWSKSMIELFIYDFLDTIEIVCNKNDKKAILCNIPNVKGEFLYHQLKFSYDSFRRIFITRESKGNKTTKNMFAIYLGYDSYIDYWMNFNKNQNTNNLDNQYGIPEKLNELHALSLNRLEGKKTIGIELLDYINQVKKDYDIAVVELAIHLYAKYRELSFFEEFKVFHSKSLNSDYAKRTMKIFECINLITNGTKQEVISKYQEAKNFNRISLQELHYLAFWEGLILLSCEQYKSSNSIMINISDFVEFTDYPFVKHSRKFDRAILKVILGNSPIEEIIAQLNLKKYKGLAHLSAVNCRVIRRNEYVLQNLITMGKMLRWKNILDFQDIWERLKLYEKEVLSNAGTLFCNNINRQGSANGRAFLEEGKV